MEAEKSDDVIAIFTQDTDHKAQFEALVQLCNKFFPEDPSMGSVNIPEMKKIIETVIAMETGSMVISRQFISLLTDRLDKGNLDENTIKTLAESILCIIKNRTISYEDQVCVLRTLLANLYEKEGRILDAAHALIAINSENCAKFTTAKGVADGIRVQLQMRITRLMLECNEIDEAEQYVNRASIGLIDVTIPGIVVEHKALQARVCDAKRRFIEAAQRYYELSTTETLPHSDRMTALAKTIICVLLAKPGVQRSRILSILFKDERAFNLPFYELVAKMYLTKVIHNKEMDEFKSTLAPHQRADESGESVLKEVLQQHNMVALSQIYVNISFKTLGAMLGITPDGAELMAGEMISTERLFGYIDQSDGILHFEEMNPIRIWDSQVASTLDQVNKVSDMIVARHPEFAGFLAK